jgi:predicted nuclease of predicted toxin-antitoxin system
MKLLLDQNLSRRMVPLLQSAYLGTTQVALLGMEESSDFSIWEYAKQQGFIIVTKDSDFYDMSTLYGTPPQVIWMKIGNVGKQETIELLLKSQTTLEKLLNNPETACIELIA